MNFSNLSNATRIKLKIDIRDRGVIKTTALIQPFTLIFVLPYLIPTKPVLQKHIFQKTTYSKQFKHQILHNSNKQCGCSLLKQMDIKPDEAKTPRITR